MPLFHSNAVMAGWGPALACGGCVALAEKFSASGLLDDVRRYGATYLNYVGKPLSYVLATPARDDDADNPLRLAFGNEAGDRDIAGFSQRFGCQVIDGFGSTENAVVISRVPGTPPGSLGVPLEGVAVLDPETEEECPRAVFDGAGRVTNLDEATGELVNTAGTGQFAGYYNDEAATAERMRGGMYWSGDLAYRDEAGFVYYAGRTADWLRVDGENLAASPIERILVRHPSIAEAAVYAVPDPASGDQLVAALVLVGRSTRPASRSSSPPRGIWARSSGRVTSGSSTHSPARRPTRCSSGSSSARRWMTRRTGCARSAAGRTPDLSALQLCPCAVPSMTPASRFDGISRIEHNRRSEAVFCQCSMLEFIHEQPAGRPSPPGGRVRGSAHLAARFPGRGAAALDDTGGQAQGADDAG